MREAVEVEKKGKACLSSIFVDMLVCKYFQNICCVVEVIFNVCFLILKYIFIYTWVFGGGKKGK